LLFGAVAEWQGGGLQNPLHMFESCQRLQKIVKMESELNKVVLTGTHEGSYGKLRNHNKKTKTKKNKLKFIKFLLKKIKK
jgi:hypothetical protein